MEVSVTDNSEDNHSSWYHDRKMVISDMRDEAYTVTDSLQYTVCICTSDFSCVVNHHWLGGGQKATSQLTMVPIPTLYFNHRRNVVLVTAL